MRVMINAPIPHLGMVDRFNQHLVLVHLLEGKYLDFYRKQREKGAYIILDNGVVETGTPQVDEKKIELLRPQEVVAPDYLFDAKRTYVESREFALWVKKRFPDIKVMCVPQGETPREYIECLDRFIQAPWCDVIGLGKAASLALTPREIRPRYPSEFFVLAGRHRALTYIMEEAKVPMTKVGVSIPVHILGLCHPRELPVYNCFPQVRTVDTSWCFRVIQREKVTDFHRKLNPKQLKKAERLLEYLEMKSQEVGR